MNQPRLFPIYAKEPLLTEDEINEIAEYLTGVKPEELASSNTKSNIAIINSQSKLKNLDAGYTYFGQFIAHEIIPCSSPEPSEHNYTTTPELDLKSLYGEPSQYSMLFDDKGKFRVSDTRPYDVIRDENGRALIPDQRNDENAIIIQFHVLWQNIHNKIIDFITLNMDKKCKVDSITIHNEARQITTSLFQYLTIYDYAERILHPDVFKCYFGTISKDSTIQTKEYILKDKNKLEAIPVEFSHAAFRFGHSMVRSDYNLDIKDDQKDQRTLTEIFRGQNNGNLPLTLKIKNWQAFFSNDLNSKATQQASNIDSRVTSSMANIPIEKHIVKLNLLAGDRAKLPSGDCISDWIFNRHKVLIRDCQLEKSEKNICGSIFKVDNQGARPLPLWLYTLQEAEFTTPYAKRLGGIASIIISEVLRKAILSQQANTSSSANCCNILQTIEKRSEPLWSIWQKSSKNKTMYSLINLPF
ncbi:peroxidase family protein [Paraglaciecola sp.]|uniref:peroxidase family protein n=1 Tax=Paraglaciecola sp. TaxID=1920173 RepID=UPI0032668387